MKNKRNIIILLILVMAIGFASISTTLLIKGNTKIGEKEEDFEIYFSGAILDGEDYTNEIISEDKKTITYETKELKRKDEESKLEYEITNGSTQYDASFEIKVTTDENGILEVVNEIEDSKLLARETRKGTLTIKLKKGAVEEKNIQIKLEIIFKGEERESIDITPIETKTYSISGYFVDENKTIVKNATLAVYSENPQYVKTDDYGYFYVGNLERGKHEIYYIEESEKGKEKEEIKKNAIDEVSVTTTGTKEIIFENGYEIEEKEIKEEEKNTISVELIKNNGEENETLELPENKIIENLPIPNKIGTKFLYWEDENGIKITNNTILSKKITNKLYAIYEANTYKISYELNGGILNNQKLQANYGEELTIENPSKELNVKINDNNQGATISENEITKTITFKGWTSGNIAATAIANNISWNGTLTKETKFKNLTNEENKEVILKANYEDENVILPSVEKEGYKCVIKDGDKEYEPSSTYVLNGNGKNVELNVECNKNTYTITYNSNGGSGNLDKTTCTYDTNCQLRKNGFSKIGYTFDHWEYNGKEYVDEATVKNLATSGNIELKAIYKANTYKISYELNGGTSSSVPTGAVYDKELTIENPSKEITISIVNNEGATIAKESIKETLTFKGWTSSNITSTAIANNISWNGTLTKETKFKNLTNENNGIVNLKANYNAKDVTLTIPTKTGYTCGYTDEENSSIKYTTNITIEENKTIYVKCNPNKYTISFNSDGGTSVENKEVTYDAKIGTLESPTKVGYTFGGWYLNNESITSESIYKEAKNIELKAKWNEATNTKYTVNYYLQNIEKEYEELTESIVYTGTTNKTVEASRKTYEGFVTPEKQNIKILADGSAKVDYYYVRKEITVIFKDGETTKEQKYIYGKENQTFTNNGFSKTGYTLKGYSDTKNGSKNYEVTNGVSGTFIDKNYPTKTIYTVWEANKYTIKYNINGGSGSMEDTICTYDTNCQLRKNTLSKTGYTFVGWSKTQTGEVAYIDESEVKNLVASGNVTLYAKCNPNTYTITYNSNGGSGSTYKTTCTYDTNCTIAGNNFTKDGYTFVNWKKDTTTGTTYEVNGTVKNLATSGNINMYASWKANTYKINYVLNNGTSGTNKPTSGTYDQNVLIDNPSKKLTVTINGNNQGATISATSVSKVQTFKGWTVSGLNTSTAKTGTSENGVTTTYTGTSTKNRYFKNLTKENNGTVTFTASYENVSLELPTITKTGYTCGYSETSTGAIKYTSGSTYTPSGETTKTLYAKCTANTYTITYNSNGGSGDTYKTTCTYDTNCTIAGNNFTKEGYLFVNWKDDNNKEYEVGSTVKNLATSGNINFYANWDLPAFTKDSWETIAANVRAGNTDMYNVGDTKTITIASHSNGSTTVAEQQATVRIANKEACTNGETSETACGFVIEFVDIIEKYKMNTTNTNVGGWKDSVIRTYLNGTIFSSLPSELQSVIANTKVISGHGSTSVESNFETTDKLYLLSTKEVWGTVYSDTVNTETKQLEYYENNGVTLDNYSGAIKKYNGSASAWWLRSAYSSNTYNFVNVDSYGDRISISANDSRGVSPTFRIAV